MTERDYAIKSFKEITLNAKRHTEQRMDLYYEKIKTLMSDYQDLILENQMVLEELEQECQDKINENMAYALQYMDVYDYRMHIGHLKKEMNNVILIYGLSDMVHRAMTLVKYFTPNFGEEYYDVLYGCYCRSRKAADVDIMIELGMSRATFYRKKKAALRYLGYYFFEIVVPQSANKRYKPSFPLEEEYHIVSEQVPETVKKEDNRSIETYRRAVQDRDGHTKNIGNDAYLTVKEAALLAGINPATVHKWIKKGKIEAVQSSKTVRIPRQAFENWLQSRKKEDQHGINC